MTPTFADALAALTAEHGEPAPPGEWSDPSRLARWDVPTSRACVWLTGFSALTITVAALPIGGGSEMVAWTLAGEGALTPLADAVRDAGAWLGARGE